MTGAALGIDTSCYTTSAAIARDSEIIANCRRLLSVKDGARGMRQSEMVFQHVNRLSAVIEEAIMSAGKARIEAVCASTRPRPVQGSYMPAFAVGEGHGRAIAAALGVPFFATSHQEGHVYAAMYNKRLTGGPFMALHLSGGTTEVLIKNGESLTLLGGAKDISAGQLVDRVGVKLAIPFPAGAELSRLAESAEPRSLIPASAEGLNCYFSGAETRAMRMIESRKYSPNQIAAEVFSCLARTLAKMIAGAHALTGAREALLFGGVAASSVLKSWLNARIDRLGAPVALHWAEPELSGDNAAGAALIGWDKRGSDK
jgi:N6-L-threonylcarbamoyladenine synthase